MSFSRVAAFGVANLRTFSPCPKFLWKMTTLEEVIGNNQRNGEIIASIKNELAAMRCEILFRRKKALRLENTELQQKVEAARRQLVALEIANGKKMFAVPSGVRSLCTEAKSTPETAPTPTASNVDSKSQSAPKEKKPKKEKPTAAAAATSAAEVAVDVGRLDMRVGKIVEIGRHPDADSLYLEKIDCGEAQPRTVVSGLVKYVPLEEMQNRMVVVLCNLKPAKMRGVTSEAMVMCASTPEKVEVLSPPAGAEPGDLVNCHGYARQPDAQLNPKKKIFETCAPDLMTNEKLEACYKGAVLHVPGKGPIVSQTLKNVNVK